MLGIKGHNFVIRRGGASHSFRSLTVGVTAGVMVLAGGFFQPNLSPAQAVPVDIATPGIYAPTVTFKDGDATIAVQQVTPGQFVAAPVLPSHDGEVFDGWWDESVDPAVLFDITTTPITADITLTAQFKPADHLVNFMVDTTGDGDYAVLKSYSVPDGQSLDEAGVTPDSVDFPDDRAPAGTFFDNKWVTSDTGLVDWTVTVTSDLTLYPSFDSGSYVWFRSGGTAVSPQVVQIGDNATEPDNPTRTGYDFDGWYTDPACAGSDTDGSVCNSSPYDFSTVVSTTNVTLYGRWLATSANYQVVYWCEKPDINPVATNIPTDTEPAFDPGTDFANYDFVTSKLLQDPSGTFFEADDTSRALAGTDLSAAQATYPAMKYAEFYTTSAATVAGDGSTIINVFYKRLVYELAFRINSSAAATLVHDGVTYGDAETAITTRTVVPGNDYIFYAKAEQNVTDAWPKPSESIRPNYNSSSWSQPTPNTDAQNPNFNLNQSNPGLTSGATVNFLDTLIVDRASLNTTADGYHLLIFSMDGNRWVPNAASFWRLAYFQATNTELGEIADWVAAGNTVRQWNEPWNLWCDRTFSGDYDSYNGCDSQEIADYESNNYPPYLEFNGNYYVYHPEQIQESYTSPLSYYGIGYPTPVGLIPAGLRDPSNGWSMIPQTPWYRRTTNGGFTAATFTAGVIDTRSGGVTGNATAGNYTLYNNSWWAFTLLDRDPATINFDTAGGKAPGLTAEQQALHFGDTVGEVGDPTPPQDGQSYVFEGWFIDPTFQIAFDPSMTMPVGGLMLFAKWLVDPVTVQFYDSTSATEPIDGLTQQVSAGSLAAEPSALATRVDGSTFQGWYYRDPESGRLMPYEWNQLVEENLDLYARWQAALTPVSVTYKGGEGAVGDSPVDAGVYPYLPGSMVRLADGQSLLRNGGQFIGWTVDDDPQMYYPGDLVEIPAGGLELTAQYGAAGPLPVQVTFVDTGADTPDVVWDSVFDATAVWPDNTDVGFTRSGYSFLGWSTDPAATTADPAYERLNQQIDLEENVTLYGVWQLIPLPVCQYDSTLAADDPACQAPAEPTTPVPDVTLEQQGTVPDPGHPKAGDVVTWTFEVENTGDVDLTGVIIDDPQVSGITCTLDGKVFTLGGTDVLPAGGVLKCTATSTVTQADIDNTGATSTASVSGTGPDGAKAYFGPVTAVAPLAQNPASEFGKTAAYGDANRNGLADVGEQIIFTITLENLGNVTLNQVKITDATMPDLVLTCTNTTIKQTVANDGSISLPPGQMVECVSSPYMITAGDAANGSVVNLAAFTAGVGNTPPPALRLPGDSTTPGSLGDGSQAVVPVAPQQKAPTGGQLAPTSSWLWLGGFAPLLAGACLLLWRRRRQAGEAV